MDLKIGVEQWRPLLEADKSYCPEMLDRGAYSHATNVVVLPAPLETQKIGASIADPQTALATNT